MLLTSPTLFSRLTSLSTPIISAKLCKTWLDHSKWMNIWMCTSADKYGNIALPYVQTASKLKQRAGEYYDGTFFHKGPYWCCVYVWLWQPVPNLLTMHMHDYMPRRLEKNLHPQPPNWVWSGAIHMNFFFGPPIYLEIKGFIYSWYLCSWVTDVWVWVHTSMIRANCREDPSIFTYPTTSIDACYMLGMRLGWHIITFMTTKPVSC